MLRIGELAELFDISTKTLRHYEKLSLLTPRRDVNGYRLYSAEDVLHVQRIRQLQRLGLSLRQIRAILDGDSASGFWKSVLQSLLAETESEIEALEARREQLETLIENDSAELVVDPLPLPHNSDVNVYLEQHLSPSALVQWRRDPSVYAFVGSVLRAKRDYAQIGLPQHEFVGWQSAEIPVGIPQNLFMVRV